MSEHSRYRAGLWLPDEKPMYGAPINPYHTLNQGLVCHLPFNDAGGNTVFDFSRYGNHGTFAAGAAAPTWVAGKTGPALDFDTNDYVDLGNPETLKIDGAITIVAKVKPMATAFLGSIVGKARYGSGAKEWSIFVDQTKFWTKMGNGTSYKAIASNSVYTSGNWYYVVATRSNAGVMHLHINGVQQDHTETLTGDINPTYNCYIGRRGYSDHYHFNGVIEEVRILNRGLSASETWQLCANPSCTFAQPMEAELMYAAPPVGLSIPVAYHHYEALRAC